MSPADEWAIPAALHTTYFMILAAVGVSAVPLQSWIYIFEGPQAKEMLC